VPTLRESQNHTPISNRKGNHDTRTDSHSFIKTSLFGDAADR
jgi:hypothetical protein